MSSYYDDNYRDYLPDDLTAPIIDLGCGQGNFVRYLHALGYRNITAVDSHARAIAALANLDGVTAIERQVDAGFLDELGTRWSLIVVKQMIYYLDRQHAPALVQSLARALAADGRLIVEIFNGAVLSSRFTELKDPAILTAYTENGLRRLLEWNGLTIEHLFGAHLGGRGLRSAIYRLAQAAWFALYRALLVIERGHDDELPRIRQKSIIAVARRG